MDATRCPICRGSAFIPGYVVNAAGGNIAAAFLPAGMQAVRSQVGVGLSSNFLSCLSCGYVWTRLEPGQLQLFIRTHGGELVKQYLDFLELGPDHDLPEVAEARLAGLGVAEIDSLVLVGQLPAATRRLRELTGRTWDEVVNAMRHWRDLKRPQKLAMLGWIPKRSFKEAESQTTGHPMRDPWLDG